MRNCVLLVLVSATLFFFNLGATHLWDVDEAIFSQAAKEMLVRGDHVVPYFNGEVFPDKPAMMYWGMISAYELFGTTEFAARFWSAICGIASVLVTYRLGRLMFSPSAGLWAGLILASNLNFNVIARAATPDAYLTFFCSLSLLAFVSSTARARALSGSPNERNAPWAGQTRFEPSWAGYAAIYAVMGLAVLTKGPIGVVLPTAVIGLFLAVIRRQRMPRAATLPGWRGKILALAAWLASVLSPLHLLRTIWSMRPLTAVAMVLVVAGPWYVLVGVRTDGQWLVDFFGVHNFGRFLNAMDNHRGPIFYYAIAMAVGFFPWSVLFGPSLLRMKQDFAEASPWSPGYTLICSWFAVWVGFFSLAGTKLPSYVVPAYPALALFTGCLVDRWLREPSAVSRVWVRLSWATTAIAGLATMVALPVIAHFYLSDDWMLGACGLAPLLGGLVGWILFERGQVRQAAYVLSALSMLLATSVFGFAAVRVDGYQDSQYFARQIAGGGETGPNVGSFRYFRPSFVFYLNQPIESLSSVEEVARFFQKHESGAYLFTTDEQFDSLSSALPPSVTVLEARPRLFRGGKVLLLGTRQQQSVARQPSSPQPSSR